MNEKINAYVKNAKTLGKEKNKIYEELSSIGVSHDVIMESLKAVFVDEGGPDQGGPEEAKIQSRIDEGRVNANSVPAAEPVGSQVKVAQGHHKKVLVVVAAVFIIILFVAFIAISLFGTVFWQLGIFNLGGSSGEGGIMTQTGFAKIRPMLAGTGLSSDGKFVGIFTNGIGTRINVKLSEVVITSSDGLSCKPTGVDFEAQSGENFKITAEGCQRGKVGEIVTLDVELPYEVYIGGITTKHTEYGTLRGSFE